MKSNIRIGWKVSLLTYKLASIRYRAILPIIGLDSLNVESKIYANFKRGKLKDIDLLVFVKSLSIDDYVLAQEAFDKNIPIIFDLCDNIFIDSYLNKNEALPSHIFHLIAELAYAIVVPTDDLAKVVFSQLKKIIPIYVIPDGIETEATISIAKRKFLWLALKELTFLNVLIRAKAIWRFLTRQTTTLAILIKHFKITHCMRSALTRMAENFKCFYEQYLSKSHPLKIRIPKQKTHKILWFGNHGAPHAEFGIKDILLVSPALKKIAIDFSIELIVVSNNQAKYEKYILPIPVKSKYYEWSHQRVRKCLSEASVVIIPNNLDDFSKSKSANRAVFALSMKVPVVATSTSALLPLSDCIVLDDFEFGIRKYLSDEFFTKSHLNLANNKITSLFGEVAIAKLWEKVIVSTLDIAKHSRKQAPGIVFSIQTPQDIDLLNPIINEATSCGVVSEVWISEKSLRRWRAIVVQAKELRVGKRVVNDMNPNITFPASTFAVISATETNLSPHKFSHQIAKLANSKGIYTATMQHGFENVGLTYSDSVHDIKKIRFESSEIFIWGSLSKLAQNIPVETLKKCTTVGISKSQFTEQISIKDITIDKQVVGLFENLHWHRYTDEYREFFISGLISIATRFPAVLFLVKPHNAGMWLSGSRKEVLENYENILVADPSDLFWANVSAPQILASLSAVITTPSTVAMDAARLNLPVAIVANTMSLANYEPLYQLKILEDWGDFIENVIYDKKPSEFLRNSNEFVEHNVEKSDAASKILQYALSHNHSNDENINNLIE